MYKNLTLLFVINKLCVFLLQFYTNLTCPLLKIIQLLKKNQDELFDLIKKKDLEIAEYVLEGGNISHSWYTVIVPLK